MNKDMAGKLIALGGMIFGIWLRILPAMLTEFPINDGGMFFEILRQIEEENFRVPVNVNYNGLEIPFMYPPLTFYLANVLHRLFSISFLDLLIWMPAIASALTVFAFYDLAHTLLKSEYEAGLAVAVFALIPRALTWLLMGGGLTRGFGELFLLLAIRQIYSTFTTGKKKHIFLAVCFSSLVVLSHPEAMVHTIGIALLIWFLSARNIQGVKQSVIIAVGVIAITSFWWIPALARHGLSPILSASQSGNHSAYAFLSPFLFAVSEEPFITIIAVLAAIGIFIALSNKQALLAALIVFPFIVEPRNAANIAIIPMAMLASLSLARLTELAFSDQVVGEHLLLSKRAARAMLILFGITSLVNSSFVAYQVGKNYLSQDTLNVFNWIQKNTPNNARFLVITGEAEGFCDPVQEWFPVFSERVSLTTIQGREWQTGISFSEYKENMTKLQRCSKENIGCVEDIATEMQLNFDYLYIQRKNQNKLVCVPRGKTARGGDLILSIAEQNSSAYVRVFFTEEAAIFKVVPK